MERKEGRKEGRIEGRKEGMKGEGMASREGGAKESQEGRTEEKGRSLLVCDRV